MKPWRFFFLEAGLLVSLISAPIFFGSVYPWFSMTLCALLFFLFLLFPEALDGFGRLAPHFRYGFLAVFSAVFLQSFFWARVPYAAQSELLKWLAYAAVFLLIQLLSQRSVFRLLAGVAFLGAFESVYGLWQVVSGKEMALWQKKESYLGFVTGTYLNRNLLAGLLELCLGVQIGIWLGGFLKRDLKWILAGGALVGLTLFGFLKTGSRMGLASFASSLLFFSIFLWERNKKISVVFFLIFASLVGVFVIYAGPENLFFRWMDRDENWFALEGRLGVWRDSLKMLGAHPWLGMGLGSFEWVYPGFQSPGNLLGWFHAHNDYLELAVELGLPVFAVLLVSFGSLWIHCVKRLPSLPPESFFPVWGMLVSVTSVLLHSLADFHLAIFANALLLIFLMGLAFRMIRLS